MDIVKPEVTGRTSGGLGVPMSLDDFVRIFALPPIVPVKRCCEILACGHSKYYVLRKGKKLRIVERPGGGSGTPVEDLYKLCIVRPGPVA